MASILEYNPKRVEILRLMGQNAKQARLIRLLYEKLQIINTPIDHSRSLYEQACEEEASLHYLDAEIQILRCGKH